MQMLFLEKRRSNDSGDGCRFYISEALRSMMSGKEIDLANCLESYNHSGRRFMLAVQINDESNWGAHKEHRVSLTLFFHIDRELQSRRNLEIRPSKSRNQFLVLLSRLVNRFTECISLFYARWYQEILGTARESELDEERQKLTILIASLLKKSYRSVHLEKYKMI